MCNPITKRGVLNDFNLARLGSPGRKPSAKDNTGTLPFLALDLLDEGALGGSVERLYRHDAESFAWCLIYIYICMAKDKKGKIGTLKPHPLPRWFMGMDSCFASKIKLVLPDFPLHQNIGSLVSKLCRFWKNRYLIMDVESGEGSGVATVGGDLGRIVSSRITPRATVQTMEP